MEQQKFIRTHRARVKAAEEIIKLFPERISIVDREAIIEFLLLEDVSRLYVHRYEKIKAKTKKTEEGRFYQAKQLEKIHYLIYMLEKCMEIMEGKIDEGSFTDVRKAIHEHQLKKSAGNVKHLDELVKYTEEMLRDVDEEVLVLAQKMLKGQEFMEDLKAHDLNARTHFGIPTTEEIAGAVEDAVNVAEDVIASSRTDPRNKPKLN